MMYDNLIIANSEIAIRDKHIELLEKDLKRMKESSDYWFNAMNNEDCDKTTKLIDLQP